MLVTIRKDRMFELIDVLLARLKAKQYPYNKPEAIVPQIVIPKELRRDKRVLALFYFYVCIYMRGGIESLQAFRALIRVWQVHPHLFEPSHFFNPSRVYLLKKPEYIQPILKEFIGWDSKEASINWVENSKRLMWNWGGDPRSLIQGLDSYDEALRRIRNKLTKRDGKTAGIRGEGFRGFQPKMVSMLLYFYDWEGWLTPRFLYPSPADFHHYRLGIANGVIVVEGDIRFDEKISAPYREMLMQYLHERNADPIEVSDAIWLYSLLLCGESPATRTKNTRREVPLFDHGEIAEEWKHDQWLDRVRKGLVRSCGSCVLESTCTYAIPASPYYREGKVILRPRAPLDQVLKVDPDKVPARRKKVQHAPRLLLGEPGE